MLAVHPPSGLGLRDVIPDPPNPISSVTYWMLALPIPYLRVFVEVVVTEEDEDDASYDPTAWQNRTSDEDARFVQSGFTQSSNDPVSS